jgi:hypothetical protein
MCHAGAKNFSKALSSTILRCDIDHEIKFTPLAQWGTRHRVGCQPRHHWQ